MKVHVYSMLDTMTGFYGHPQYYRNEKEARAMVLRSVDAMLDTGVPFDSVHSKMVYLGTFDDETGEIAPDSCESFDFVVADLLPEEMNTDDQD